MNKQPRDEFKDMMNELIDNLKKNGMSVANAAILDMGDKNNPNIDQEVSRVLREMGKARFPGTTMPTGQMNKDDGPRGEPEFKGKCFCPVCFNFDTFEEVLKDLGGSFDYTSVNLGGKVFDLKYWISPTGKEKLIVSLHKEESKETYEGSSLEELQTYLNEAVGAKDFTEAQVILDIINKTKNKN